MAHDPDPGTPVAWTAMPYRAPVLDKEGNLIGTTESLLGDEASDIFHSIVVKTEIGHNLKEIPGDQITRITTTTVHTDVDPSAVDALEPYAEAHQFHAGWGGLFRKHPRWMEDGDR
jgi:hypothetical protein